MKSIMWLSSSEVTRKLDISFRQLYYWELKGIVRPRLIAMGSRDFKRYSARDFEKLRRIKEFLDLTSSTQTGVAVVTATYGQTFRDTVQVVFGQSLPTFLNVSAEPPVIFVDNQSTSRIKAVVSDQNNNSDGTQINFEIYEGSGTIESNKVTAAGMATSMLTSSTQPDTIRDEP